MSEKKIKVTDRRPFTADGELRNEYRDEVETEPPEVRESTGPAPAEAPAAQSRDSSADASSQPESPSSKGPEPPLQGAGYVPPTFFDLVGVVAQPIALYLGDAKMPDGESLENLELARLYIDLLEILQKKSAGNLAEQEEGFLKDLLYQLRMRYLEKSG